MADTCGSTLIILFILDYYMGIEDVFVAKRLIATLYELLNIFKKK